MWVRIGKMSSTARMILCVLLASFLAVTPLGAHARLTLPGSDLVPDLCTTSGDPVGTPAAPSAPSPHSAIHAQCGDCSMCGIAFVPRGSPGLLATLIVATPLDALAAAAPVKSLVGGIVARPRGPPAVS